MKKIIIALFFLVFSISLGHASEIEVKNAWGKPNYGPNGAAYITLTNKGTKAARLIGVQTPKSTLTQIHTHLHENGVMKMRQVKHGIEIAPNQTITFAPGGYHIMFLGLKEKLKPGQTLPLTLIFQDGHQQTITATIKQ